MDTTVKKLRIAFLLLVFFSSAFYIMADFGKTTTVYCGIIQAVVLIPSAIIVLRKTSWISTFTVGVLVAMNMLPLALWIMFSGASFGLFGIHVLSNIPMTLFHLVVLAVGLWYILETHKALRAKRVEVSQ